MKEYVKSRLVTFWETHKNFDDRNPRHIAEAEKLLKELLHDFPPAVIIEAVEELRSEAEKEFEQAMERFYAKLREVQKR